jgi:hypothetical protein
MGGRRGTFIGTTFRAKPPRLTPPPGLSAQERKLFVQLVAATSPNHFGAGDIPMLVAFVQASLLSHKLGRNSANVGDWEKVTRTMSTLAVRLRLCPHSRIRAEAAHLQPKAAWSRRAGQSPPPWEGERSDDEALQ